MMTITRYRYITKHLCLLLLLTVGAGGAWAADDTFTVTAETPTTLGETIYTGTYTTLTLGVSPDASSNTFSVTGENGAHQIAGTQNPRNGESNVGTGQVPNQGSFFIIQVTKPGDFVFTIKLNQSKRVHFRKSDGTEVSTRQNDVDENQYLDWPVTVAEAGTYYLYGDGTKLPLFGYTFTRKVPTGITSLPYHADFGSDIEPFDDGNNATVASTNSVFTINSVAPNSGTAIARFNGVHTLASTEQVTLSFTAYHGYYSKGESKVTLYNSDDVPLISYTYGKTSGNVTNVAFNEVTDNDFAAFNARSHYSGDSNANGFGGNGRPFTNTAADNPVVTMTVAGSGLVTFNLTRGYGSVSQSFNELLDGVKMDLAYIKIEDNSDNVDRGLGIDNLSITSQLASLDYETGVVDWTTSVDGRYTPVILTESTNHYLSVNQSQRADGSGGATISSTSLDGKVVAGQDFTISFDMKIGNNNRSGTTVPPTFTVFAANNSDAVFTMESTAANGTEWRLNDTENVTLAGTGSTNGSDITSLTWYHYTISKTNGYVYVTIDSQDGLTHHFRKGFSNSAAGGLGKLQFVTGKDHANFAIDNIQVVPYASTSFTQNGKVETYTIMGEGALPQVDEGKTIKIEYGAANEVQMTEQLAGTTTYGSYAIDTNTTGTFSQAYGTGSSMIGTFYKLTPKYNGKVTISGWVNVVNNITITDATGAVIDEWKSAGITANSLFTHDFTTELSAGTDYYLYGCAPNTPNTGTPNEGTDNYAILHLTGLTFTQTSMNREIVVSDLLYAGSKTEGNLARTIPGMTLAFNNKVTSGAGRDYLNFVSDGTMTVTLRQNGYSATITGITLVKDGAKLATGGSTYEVSISGGVATVTAHTTLSASSFIVSYNASDATSYNLWLNEDKTDIGTFAFSDNHIMRVPGDGVAFTNSITFSDDDANKWWVENTDYVHTSSNTSVATINTNGTNGQLQQAGTATITATFAATDYFNAKTATFTVNNVLMTGETYNVDVTSGKILRVGAYADAENTTLLLNGGHTNATSFTYGNSLEKLYTRTTSEGTVIVKNETDNNITINTLQVLTPTPVAYLYYEGQEENYSQQLVFQGLPSGPVQGFRVLDIGDPTDPIDLTSAYSLKSGVGYVWTNGTLVTSHGGTFNTGNGEFKISSKASGGETTLPKVSHMLTKTGTADGYDDELTADANIFVAVPVDTDGDSTADTYKTWDMTTSVSSWGQMDSRWTWNGHGYYQAWLPEYLPILNNSGTTLAGNEGLLATGDLRYYTGSAGLRMNLTRVNGRLKFPVKAGMEIKVEMASTSADIEHLISNVTDLFGNAVSTVYIENAGSEAPITAYFLAAADGAVELRSMDKLGAYVKRITLQVPQIHFNEEVVTVKNEVAEITNVPYNTGDATLTYAIAGSYNLDGTTAGSALATIADEHVGKVSVSGTSEGYVVVSVINPSATDVQPRKGSFKLYMIDFRFDQTSYDSYYDGSDADSDADFPSLNLSSAAAAANGGEAVFNQLPTGYNKVVQPVNYTMEYVSGEPRGRLIQKTNQDPKQTTYALTVYSAGTLRVTATTGRISTSCEVVVTGGNQFAELNPARRLDQLDTEGTPATRYFLNKLPAGFNSSGTTKYTVDLAGTAHCDGVTTHSVTDDNNTPDNDTDDVTTYYAKIANITGAGAIRVTATNDSNTPGETSDDKTATFVLTVAYPASSSHKWDFYRMKNASSGVDYGLYIGKIDDYNGDATQTAKPNPKPVNSHETTQRWSTDASTWTNPWTTNTKWEKVYRKGNEQPRWAYAYGVKGDNAFIVEETAGMQIETGPQGFYIDNPHQPTEFGYNHIGLHNNATVTIPRLKAGDYIALNLSRVLPNNGAILSATNVTDLAGTAVNHTFTITRSQIDYQDAGVPVTEISGDNVGARVIPGYYTFRAAADGDVSFTLSDEGYLDILSIEIYDGSYKPTMTGIVTDGTNVAPPATFLMDDGETEEVNLAICHLMKSTSVGPAEYVVVDKVGGLDATLENVEWVSDGGALYNKGKITVNDSYGKLLVRMNNYTADGRYLTGYTPTYSLTVGHKPHQDYPFTWNFQNISGGAVLGRPNNAYNSISTDYYTWQNLGYETFMLNTTTAVGSLYVPGATLVASSHDLGQKGEISYLNANNYGCDEFNGLGFTGQIAFKLAQQGETANDVPTGVWAQGKENSLLEYSLTAANVSTYESTQKSESEGVVTWTSARLEAGDGYVTFGSPGKLESTEIGETGTYITTTPYAYRMDGGNTKNVLLEPQRPFQNGDVVHLKGYAPNTVNPQKSGFSFYAGATDAATAALATVYFAADAVVDTEYSIDYTIKYGDGICGRSQVYLCRADKTTTVLLSEVSITGDDSSAPTAYERAITCMEETTITMPDLTAGDFVYLKSSAAPSSSTYLTDAVAADGLDAKADGDGKVYRKYKVTANGNATLTFAAGTKIYRIGVTNIMKPLTRVGSGDAWATESRDHAIDYKQTGVFTVNDITANTVTAKTYGLQRITVTMNPQTDAMPAETGMVLKLPLVGADDDATTANVNKFAKAKNYNITNKTGEVPLFYPPHSTPILSDAVKFGGSQENLMMANLDKRELKYERETGVIDNDGDDFDDSGVADGNYTRFIFASRYMKWTKGETLEHSNFTDGDAPVFYRLHIYDDTEATALLKDKTTLNTLGFNKAYMLIHSGNVPEALWNTGGGSAKEFIGIEGISDIYDWDEAPENPQSRVNSGTYSLSGQKVDDNGSLPAGVYIKNGKKVIIK